MELIQSVFLYSLYTCTLQIQPPDQTVIEVSSIVDNPVLFICLKIQCVKIKPKYIGPVFKDTCLDCYGKYVQVPGVDSEI